MDSLLSSPDEARTKSSTHHTKEPSTLMLPEPMMKDSNGSSSSMMAKNGKMKANHRTPPIHSGSEGSGSPMIERLFDQSPNVSTPRGRSSQKRDVTSQSSIKRIFSGNSLHLFKKGSESRPTSPSRKSSSNIRQSLSMSALGSLATPEIKAMVKREWVPDLESVNRALEDFRLNADECEEKQLVILDLSNLATELKNAKECKKLLNEAMTERNKGNVEICRGKCIQILHNGQAEAETRIYANNILSTLSSVGQATQYLDESTKLIKENVKQYPNLEKLSGVVSMLRERTEAREAEITNSKRKVSGDEAGESGGMGSVTPVSAKIVEWASLDER